MSPIAPVLPSRRRRRQSGRSPAGRTNTHQEQGRRRYPRSVRLLRMRSSGRWSVSPRGSPRFRATRRIPAPASRIPRSSAAAHLWMTRRLRSSADGRAGGSSSRSCKGTASGPGAGSFRHHVARHAGHARSGIHRYRLVRSPPMPVLSIINSAKATAKAFRLRLCIESIDHGIEASRLPRHSRQRSERARDADNQAMIPVFVNPDAGPVPF